MRVLGLVGSVTVLALSLLAHFLTFVPGVPISMGYVWPLHLGTMAVGGLMILGGIIASASCRHTATRREGEGMFDFWRRARTRNRRLLWRLLKMIPLPARVAFVALMAYAFISTWVLALGMMEGTPEHKDGRYYLHNHGAWVRDLTREGYVYQEALIVRFFSGGWMIFSALSTVFFAFISPKLAERPAENDEPPGHSP